MTPRDLAPHDAELIAAFIDKRLSEEDRKAFLERLDKDEALYEVFVETVRFRDQGSPGDSKLLKYSAWRRKLLMPAAIAALLAVAIATPMVLRLLSERSYAETLVADGRLDTFLDEGWYQQPWSEMRGTQTGTDESAVAFRIGVRVIDLEIALRSRRADDAEFLAKRVEALLQGIEFSEQLQVSYAEIANRIEGEGITSIVLQSAETVDSHVREHFLDSEHFYTLGKWVEAGKLAARSGNVGLLDSRRFTQALSELGKEHWPKEVKRDLDRLSRMLIDSAKIPDLRLLEEVFENIIRES